MAALYGLDDMQKDQLMQWEIERELESCHPLVPHIFLTQDIAEGNDIVLISDMYLPKEVIESSASESRSTISNASFVCIQWKSEIKHNWKMLF